LTRLVVEVEEEQQQYVPFKTITFFFPYHKYRVFPEDVSNNNGNDTIDDFNPAQGDIKGSDCEVA
jgi:hypothetical protein